MQSYLQHLLQDIAAAAINPDELPNDGPEPDTFEAHIWESEPDLNRLDAEWYRLLQALAAARARFEAAQTPNRQAVLALCRQLEEVWIAKHRDDYSIWYSPKPEEVPNSPGRT